MLLNVVNSDIPHIIFSIWSLIQHNHKSKGHMMYSQNGLPQVKTAKFLIMKTAPTMLIRMRQIVIVLNEFPESEQKVDLLSKRVFC